MRPNMRRRFGPGIARLSVLMTFRHILLIAGVIVGTAVSAAAPHPVSLTSLHIDTRDAVVPVAAVSADAALLVQFPGPVTALI